jgi:spore coat polysaccharide biosynthesis predicted glycosyltransferase SpsG
MLKTKFKNYHEFEDYEEMIKKTDILITASPQAVLESLACGGKPIYFQREDYTQDFQQLFDKLNVPIILNYNKHQLSEVIKSISTHKYLKIGQNSNKITNFIKETLNL